MEKNIIYHDDCIDRLKEFEDDSVDIIIADPPYNLGKGGNWQISQTTKPKGFGGDWIKAMENWDDMGFGDYFRFSIAWLSECKRILKDSGSIWIHGTYHNIGIMNVVMQLLEIEIINEVIWFKRNSFPNLSGTRLTASHETMLWGHTGNPKKRNYNFNYELSKELEFPEDKIKKEGKQMRTVWDIPNNKKKEELQYGKHPTQKPVRVIQRMLKISAKKGDVVLAPFSGAGTECVSAKSLGLDYIGIEKELEYVDLSLERLKNTVKGDFFE